MVKQMAETHPAVIPSFGLHPWYYAAIKTLEGYLSARIKILMFSFLAGQQVGGEALAKLVDTLKIST